MAAEWSENDYQATYGTNHFSHQNGSTFYQPYYPPGNWPQEYYGNINTAPHRRGNGNRPFSRNPGLPRVSGGPRGAQRNQGERNAVFPEPFHSLPQDSGDDFYGPGSVSFPVRNGSGGDVRNIRRAVKSSGPLGGHHGHPERTTDLNHEPTGIIQDNTYGGSSSIRPLNGVTTNAFHDTHHNGQRGMDPHGLSNAARPTRTPGRNDRSHRGRRRSGVFNGDGMRETDNWQRNPGRPVMEERFDHSENRPLGSMLNPDPGHQNPPINSVHDMHPPLIASVPPFYVPQDNHQAQKVHVKATRAVYRPGRRVVKVEDKNQRERLTEELTKEKLECQFCFERVWTRQSTWSCESCYNVFHLKCVRGWASTCKRESEDSTWRCMICQIVLADEPRQYLCFCRKQENPEWDPNSIPHSCGQVCEKLGNKGNCDHPCTELCHPGPCPTCQRLVSKSCACGKVQVKEQCSSQSIHVCENVCEKSLNCGVHVCPRKCHVGDCEACDVKVEKVCFCGRDMKVVSCLESRLTAFAEGFSCGGLCGNMLQCGNHTCTRRCHNGDCKPCDRSPEVVTKCPCGKNLLKDLDAVVRKSCLDPIPTCGEICGKELGCGTGRNKHFCETACHDGPCAPCGKKTAVSCLCGSSTQVIPCAELTPEILQWTCTKKCQKKMLCGRHKCENICCNFDEHVCMRSCGKRLTCGLHNCEDPCGHPGHCRRCYNTSFEERTCRCGFTIQQPPIPCGAPLPDCKQPCSLDHPCGHPPTHTCHGDPQCPPCTFLCEKLCFGGHETRRNIPCHMPGISCGRGCLKSLQCGVHFCRKICHPDVCQVPGDKCSQSCTLVYRKCGHPCNMPCHGMSKCPITPCKTVVEVTCECKLRRQKIACHQHDKLLMEYLRRKQEQQAALKLSDLESFRYAMPTDVLECDEECRKVERNKSMALALKLDETDTTTSAPGPPVYSEELKKYARENLRWATQVETSIQSLVQTARNSGASRRVHQFQPMKYEQRKFLHELAGFYGCETQSYDEEPVRSITVVAKPDKILVPTVPLHHVVAAERPAKQTAKFTTSILKGAAQVHNEHVEKEKFSWPVQMPDVRTVGMRDEKRSAPPVVDYFDVTD